MAIIRARTCRECGEQITDAISLRYRLGSGCRKKKTAEELRAALELTKTEADPGYIPPARQPTIRAAATNARARATIEQARRPSVCPDHGGIIGDCAGCRHELAHPAARIIAQIKDLSHDDRRTERINVLASRYANVAPWSSDPTQRSRRRPPTRPSGPDQLEIT